MAVFRLDRLTPKQVRLLRAVLGAAGVRRESALVGGAVLDACRQRCAALPADLHVAVSDGALEIVRRVAARVGASFVVLDAARGAASVVASGMQLDLADFRAPTLETD